MIARSIKGFLAVAFLPTTLVAQEPEPPGPVRAAAGPEWFEGSRHVALGAAWTPRVGRLLRAGPEFRLLWDPGIDDHHDEVYGAVALLDLADRPGAAVAYLLGTAGIWRVVDEGESETRAGVGVGCGARIPMGRVSIEPEGRYDIRERGLFLGVGVAF